MSEQLDLCGQKLAADNLYWKCIQDSKFIQVLNSPLLNASNISCSQVCPSNPSWPLPKLCCQAALKAKECRLSQSSDSTLISCKKLFDGAIFESYRCSITVPQISLCVLVGVAIAFIVLFIVRLKSKPHTRFQTLKRRGDEIMISPRASLELITQQDQTNDTKTGISSSVQGSNEQSVADKVRNSNKVKKFCCKLHFLPDYISSIERWKRQLRILLWKNWLLKVRSPKVFVIELAAPIVFVLLLVIILVSARLYREEKIISGCLRLEFSDPDSPRMDMYTKLQPVVGIFFIICFSQLIVNMVTALMVEEETGIREGLRIMGLKDGPLIVSWYISYVYIVAPLAAVLAIECKFGLIFVHSDIATLFYVFFTFGLSMISYTHLIRAFFSHSKPATVTASLVVYVLYLLSLVLSSSPVKLQTIACLSAPTCLGITVYNMMGESAKGYGFSYQIQRFNQSLGNPHLEAGEAAWIMFADSAIYLFVGWYFDKVIQKSYGVHKPWYFIFSRIIHLKGLRLKDDGNISLTAGRHELSPRRYIRPSSDLRRRRNPYVNLSEGIEDPAILQEQSRSDGDAPASVPVLLNSPNYYVTDIHTPDNVEENLSIELLELLKQNKCIEISNLTKIFKIPGGKKVAVNRLCVKMFENQITALLGKNGAGKTTTISMLTGLIEPTRGDATVYGRSIRENMEAIRQSMGVCPQKDILYKMLTVREHLRLFYALKGTTESDIASEIDLQSRRLDLYEKLDEKVINLSGGQKRKLSVAIAFLGNNKLIVLDEPTAGMDPYSRRKTWDMLLANRHGKIIVLTTHYLDEADLLGDRIAIIASGRVKCCGTSLYLKQRHGAGYTLTVVKRPYVTDKKILSKIQDFIAKFTIVKQNTSENEVAVKLSLEYTSVFPSLLSALDTSSLISSYGLSVTTLEEVFLKVASEDPEDDEDSLLDSVSSKEMNENRDSIQQELYNGSYAENGDRKPCRQLYALLKKRYQYARRDHKWSAMIFILPAFLLILFLFFPRINIIKMASGSLGLNQDISSGTEKCTSVVSYSFTEGFCCDPIQNQTLSQCVSKYPQCLYYAVDNFSKMYSVCRGNMPLTQGFCQYMPSICNIDSCCDYSNPISPYYTCQANTPLIGYNHLNWNVACPKRIYAYVDGMVNAFICSAVIQLALSFIPAATVSYVVIEKEAHHDAKHLQILSGVDVMQYWIAFLMWDFTFAVIQGIIAWACLPLYHTFKNDINAIIAGGVLIIFYLTSMVPLSYSISFRYKHHAKAQADIITFQLVCGILLGALGYAMQIVDANAVTKSSFSFAEVYDIIRYVAMLSPPFALMDGLTKIQTRTYAFCVMKNCENGLYCSPCDSEMLPGYFSSQIIFLNLLYMFGTALLSGLYISLKEMIIQSPYKKHWLMSISHPFKSLKHDSEMDEEYSSDLIHQHFEGRVSNIGFFNDPMSEPKDVTDERDRVEAGFGGNDVVQLRRLHKKFGKHKVVLKDLTFGVKTGECFGYLGFNGAGKTTTIKILTGILRATSGTAVLAGFDIRKDLASIRKLIGYCPQYDAHLDLLSVEEHLQFYASLRGSCDIKKTVEEKLMELKLLPHRYKLAHTLSGGNRRKLSVAIALIGSPKIIFMDEPSTGMDPLNRRLVWDSIRDICCKKQCAIILTTHSMEECEVLCSRAGILSGGELQCIGSIQDLKYRFGQGYRLEIKTSTPKTEEIINLARSLEGWEINSETIEEICQILNKPMRKDIIHEESPGGWIVAHYLSNEGKMPTEAFCDWWIQEDIFDGLLEFMYINLPNSFMEERHGPYVSLQLKKENVSLSHIFQIIEHNKVALKIEEYNITQCTLEQVFNSFGGAKYDQRDGMFGPISAVPKRTPGNLSHTFGRLSIQKPSELPRRSPYFDMKTPGLPPT